MPISADEWNKGQTSSQLEAMIETFLQQNKGQAYTSLEILSNLYQSRLHDLPNFLSNLGLNFSLMFGIQSALKKLGDKGIIKSKIIEKNGFSGEYYILG
jgi:hypothetical protein